MRNSMMVGLAAAAMAMFVVTAGAAEPPAKKEEPKKQPQAEFELGEVRVLQLPAVTYVYGSAETTFEKITEPIAKFMPVLEKAIDDGKIRPVGTFMFVYKGVAEDMSKPFTMEVGWLASAEKSKAVEGLKTRKIEGGKYATLIFTGPVSKISKAYEKVMPAAAAAGMVQGGEVREVYLYWEGVESPNNVVQIQVPVK